MKLSGGLHAEWTLGDTGLSGVELWRKVAAGAYAKLVSLPATANSYHDASATTASSTYCYKVKTLRGSHESDFSNEKCQSP